MEISSSTSMVRSDTASARLKSASVELEATFLAEMLRAAGMDKTRQSFGGGAGEDQFASFLLQQQARQMAQAGGIGLSEMLFNAMMEKAHAN